MAIAFGQKWLRCVKLPFEWIGRPTSGWLSASASFCTCVGIKRSDQVISICMWWRWMIRELRHIDECQPEAIVTLNVHVDPQDFLLPHGLFILVELDDQNRGNSKHRVTYGIQVTLHQWHRPCCQKMMATTENWSCYSSISHARLSA